MPGVLVVGSGAFSCSLRQNEIGEVLEDPPVLQRPINDSQKLTHQRDNRFLQFGAGFRNGFLQLRDASISLIDACAMGRKATGSKYARVFR
jgi:hypothetical protein